MIAALRRIEAKDFWPVATLTTYALTIALMQVMALILTGVIETPVFMLKRPVLVAVGICMFASMLTIYIEIRTIHAAYPSARTAPRWFFWGAIASVVLSVVTVCIFTILLFIDEMFRHG